MVPPMAARARYEITVAGHVGAELAGALDLVVVVDGEGRTVLRGELDQPALYGVLRRIGDLGLELLRVSRQPDDDPDTGAAGTLRAS
jgi:hypothetical protein